MAWSDCSSLGSVDHDLRVHAFVDERRVDDAGISMLELARARHALAYLKERLGNEAMRALLADDLKLMEARVRSWVEASEGAWQSASLRLVVPGPSAAAFQRWYVEAMAGAREVELRAGHPEHFLSHPASGIVEVIENVGETDLPWHVSYRPLPDDIAYPTTWEAGYDLRYGMEMLGADGLRVGFSMRQSRDADDGLHLRFTTLLPRAAPPELTLRHLNHFAIEFRNWTSMARRGLAAKASAVPDSVAPTAPFIREREDTV